VERRDLTDLIRFSDDGPRTQTLLETERLWSQVVCLQRAQGIGPLSDPGADGLLIVLAGEVAVQIGKGRSRLKQWGSVVVPAAESLTVRNASDEPGVVLIVTAPPPSPPGASATPAQDEGPEAIT
jgi:mannose-6-phosphate isomerase-like protein (cupin superfamily)